MTELTVIGLGYIGLPTATIFAAGGLSVRGVDVDQDVAASVNAGQAHIVEPGLSDMVSSAVTQGRLRASTTYGSSESFVIAVPTPLIDGRRPDLRFVRTAVESLAPHLSSGNLVVLESTSPVGTVDRIADWLRKLRPDLSFGTSPTSEEPVSIAYCPERVLPGNILHELINNDRIIGGLTPECAERAAALYQRVVKGQSRLTNARTAELAKLTENAFRDVNIAFANELSLVAEEVHVNVWELIELANLHPRVNILQPGPGVGGHCIAVDPWFIVDASQRTPLIEAARRVNDGKPSWVVALVNDFAVDMPQPTIACLGLAYKPDIDDLRESPSIEIVRQLADRPNRRILVAEPNIDSLPAELESTSAELVSVANAVNQADIVVGLVAHREIRELPEGLLDGKHLVDPAGIFERTRGG